MASKEDRPQKGRMKPIKWGFDVDELGVLQLAMSE
jgi:hypothetical protein